PPFSADALDKKIENAQSKRKPERRSLKNCQLVSASMFSELEIVMRGQSFNRPIITSARKTRRFPCDSATVRRSTHAVDATRPIYSQYSHLNRPRRSKRRLCCKTLLTR